MTAEDLIGWVAAVLSAVWAFPQFLRIVRVRSIGGVSSRAWQATLWTGTAWTVYGVLTDRPQVIWCNLFMITLTFLILHLVGRGSQVRWTVLWLPPLAGASATLGAWGTFGPVAFTVILALPMLGAQSLHLRTAIVAADTTGLSIVALGVGSSSQALWAGYGWLTDSLPILALNVVGASLLAATILVATSRRRAVTNDSCGRSWPT